MQRDVQAMAGGSAGGLAGTAVMTIVMLAAQKAGLLGSFPPERVTDAALDAAHVHDEPGEARDTMTLAAHILFGSSMGALFGLLRRRLRLPVNPALQGIAFGSLLWAGSYHGWLPALGILPWPEQDRLGRPLTMVLAHWVYGATLGTITSRIHQGDTEARRPHGG